MDRTEDSETTSKQNEREGWVWAAIYAESHPHFVAVIIVGLSYR